jgi:hypothetical protein
MKNQDFTLKSGAKLSVTMAPFEKTIALKEAVDEVLLSVDPNWDEADPRVNMKILTSPKVRAAVFACGDTALYENVRVTPGLFDDPKIGLQAYGDYHEIMGDIIKVNRSPFFLTNSLSSTASSAIPTDGQKSP